MTEQELRRALAICEEFAAAAKGWSPASDRSYRMFWEKWIDSVGNPATGYAATLRALLEARELLKRSIGTHYECVMSQEECGECQKVRAFLAEGESK